MKEAWKECKLGDIVKIKHGYAFEGKFISSDDNNIVLVTPGNFAIGGGFQEKKCKFFHSTYPSEYILRENDIIVTMTDLSKDGDTLGYSAKVPYSDKRIYLHNQRIGLVQFIKSEVDKNFIYWFMRSPLYQKTVLSTSSGSTVKHTSPNRICEISINLPPLATQQKIAKILSSLDEKIELNNKINDNLEQQAQAIYDELFNNDDRNIILGDIIETISGGTPSRKNMAFYTNGNYCWVKSKELQSSFIIDTEEKITDDAINNSAAKLLPKNSVLIAMYGATVGAYGIISKDMTCNQAICALLPNENYPYSYLFMFAKNITHELENLAVGSAQQNISQILIKKLKVHSDTNKIKEFHSYTHSLFEKKLLIEQENKNLSNLRDTLLPKLMSGEIEMEL